MDKKLQQALNALKFAADEIIEFHKQLPNQSQPNMPYPFEVWVN